MDGQTSQQTTQPIGSAVSYPTQLQEAKEAVASLTKLLLESGKTITVLRRELRGEALYQSDDGIQEETEHYNTKGDRVF